MEKINRKTTPYYGIVTNIQTIKEIENQNCPLRWQIGDLVKVISSAKKQRIHFIAIAFVKNNKIEWNTDCYTCDESHIQAVNKHIFNVLISIRDNRNRIEILKNEESVKFLMNVKVGMNFFISGSTLNRKDNVRCSVKFVGNVSEKGPGVYYGFELYDEDDKVHEKDNLHEQYFQSNANQGFLRNAECFFNKSHRIVHTMKRITEDEHSEILKSFVH